MIMYSCNIIIYSFKHIYNAPRAWRSILERTFLPEELPPKGSFRASG